MPAAVPQTPRFCLTDPPHTHRAGRPVRLGSRLEPVPHAALDNQRLSPRGLSLGGADANPVSPTEVRQQGPGRTGGRPGTAGGGPPICPQPLALGQPWTRPGVPGLGDVPGGVRPPQVSPVVELAWRAQGGGRPREREIHRGIFRSPLWSFRPPVSKRSTTPPKARSSTPPPGDSSGNGGGGGGPTAPVGRPSARPVPSRTQRSGLPPSTPSAHPWGSERPPRSLGRPDRAHSGPRTGSGRVRAQSAREERGDRGQRKWTGPASGPLVPGPPLGSAWGSGPGRGATPDLGAPEQSGPA